MALAMAPGAVADTETPAPPEASTLPDVEDDQTDPGEDVSKQEPTPEPSKEVQQRGQRMGVTSVPADRPYGSAYPVVVEANFSRPYFDRGAGNADYALLNDLERMIRGSYLTPGGKIKPYSQRKRTKIYVSVSRMESSKRVGREMVKAAQKGVTVKFIHGKATQSGASRSLVKKLSAQKTGHVKICSKGKSLACLSTLSGAIIHSKIVMVSETYTRDGRAARGAIWTGSSNYGGRSAERTYNNGTTVYNDKKLWTQMSRLWGDLWAKRNINNDYLKYVKARSSNYGYSTAKSHGYTENYAKHGMFYSNLANYTIYQTPIRATPSNGRDPVLNMLNRVVPDDQCRIRLLENRFKYRRIAVAHKLAGLSHQGCRVSAVAFRDDTKAARKMHCKQILRICEPILDVLKTGGTEIDTAYAHPHDKTILVEAKMKPNKLNPEERTPEGRVWPGSGHRTTLVLSGSASLTGSNLVMSDEITNETTDPAIYESYLEHWKAITTTKSYKVFKY